VKEGWVQMARGAGQVSRLSEEGYQPVEVKDGGFIYRLDGFSGAVYEVS
jgi:hypothetical protein